MSYMDMQDRFWEIMAKKLAGEASAKELEELEAILRRDPELHYPLQTISDLWFQQGPETEDINGPYERHLARMKNLGIGLPEVRPAAPETEGLESELPTGHKPFRVVKMISWSAAAMLLLIAGWYLFIKESHPPSSVKAPLLANNNEVSTKNGSKTNIMLPDGTQVWLNAGSKLTYGKDFGTELREVTLSGEAFFDVVKDTAHPFVIHARNIDIRVLGTAFNVKSYPEDKTTETSLIRGRVEINIHNRPAEKIILQPNEKLIVAAEPDSIKSSPKPALVSATPPPRVVLSDVQYDEQESVIVETSWMDNKLIFRDESFADLAVRLERWYGVEFVFTDPKLAALRFTGTFKGESLQVALRALKITGNFDYRIEQNTVIISPEKNR
jgi:transmembrane sensor